MAGSTIKGSTPFVFLKEVRAELKKVNWPSRAQVTRLTLIVVGVSVVIAAFIGSLDFIFTKLIEVLLKLT